MTFGQYESSLELVTTREAEEVKVAIIDLGTNSVRLFIYKTGRKKAFQRVLKSKVMVRLGDGLFENGRLADVAITRTIQAFDHFDTIIQKHQPDWIRAIATSALREARERRRIVRPVRDRTGIEIEVITGKEEARLIATGVTRSLPLADQPYVFIDIGGGSTEISLTAGKDVLFSISLPLGAARNQQTFLCQVPPVQRVSGKGINALRNHIRHVLETMIPARRYTQAPIAIGTSGSIRAFRRLAINAGFKEQTFPVSWLRQLINDMKSMSREELLQLPSIEPKRTDLILSAGIILDEICRYFKCREIKATSVALKDGILADIEDTLYAKKNR